MIGGIDSRLTNGYWWSGTSSSATGGRRLATASGDVGYVGFHDGLNRGYGFAIRCVVREG